MPEVVQILLGFSSVPGIKVVCDKDRLRPIDANYQMFDNTKIRSAINWRPEIPVKKMFEDLLNQGF